MSDSDLVCLLLLASFVLSLVAYFVHRQFVYRRLKEKELEEVRVASANAVRGVAVASDVVRQVLENRNLESWQTAAMTLRESSLRSVESAESVAEMSCSAAVSGDVEAARDLLSQAHLLVSSAKNCLKEYEAQLVSDADACARLSSDLERARARLSVIRASIDSAMAEGYRVGNLLAGLPRDLIGLSEDPYEAVEQLGKRMSVAEQMCKFCRDLQMMKAETDARLSKLRGQLPAIKDMVLATSACIGTIVSEFGEVNSAGLSAADGSDADIEDLLVESERLNSAEVMDLGGARSVLESAEKSVSAVHTRLVDAVYRLEEVRKISDEAALKLERARKLVESVQHLSLHGILEKLVVKPVDWLAFDREVTSLFKLEERRERERLDRELERKARRDREEIDRRFKENNKRYHGYE